MKFMPLYEAVASTSTGQPGLMSPVSTLSEKMRCFLVAPPSGVIIASKKSAREARSTTGVPVMPMGSNLVQMRSSAGTGGAHISLPDNAAVHSVERVHIIRFGHRNDHRPAAWTALDVKRLRINVADNCAVKVQVARQIRGSGWREGRIDVKAVTRIMVVKLGNVDLCVCGGESRSEQQGTILQ